MLSNHKAKYLAYVTVTVLIVVLLVACGKSTDTGDIADIASSYSTDEQALPASSTVSTSEFKSNVGLQDDSASESTENVSSSSISGYASSEPFVGFCNVIGHTVVPRVNVDGSSCNKYLSSVKLSDFDVSFETAMTDKDYSSARYYLVGTEQDKSTEKDGDLKSLGWLMDNYSKLDANTPVYFTNLHIIGNLNKSGVSLLCSYDWYSAYGLKNTLVLFNDASGTLKNSSFADGDVISTVAFVHNIKVVTVNGQNVAVVEYVNS